MTRRLLLLRHGEASSPAGVADWDRPLTRRGTEQCRRLGDLLPDGGTGTDWRAAHVVVSPALRAQQTWAALSAAVGYVDSAVTDARLYPGSVDAVVEVVRETPPDAPTMLVVGHNPSVSGAAASLDAWPDPALAARLRDGYPTGMLTTFEVDLDWAQVGPDAARLVDTRHVRP